MVSVYAVFNTKDAAELAVEHISHVVPGARVRHLSRTRPRQDENGHFPFGAVFPALGSAGSSGAGGYFAPYPMIDGMLDADSGAADSRDPDTQTALCVQVTDKAAAERAANIMRQMGGTGVRTDMPQGEQRRT